MKKEYKTPVIKKIDLSTESPLLSDSNFDKTNDAVVGGGTDNDFSNRRSIWGDTEW